MYILHQLTGVSFSKLIVTNFDLFHFNRDDNNFYSFVSYYWKLAKHPNTYIRVVWKTINIENVLLPRVKSIFFESRTELFSRPSFLLKETISECAVCIHCHYVRQSDILKKIAGGGEIKNKHHPGICVLKYACIFKNKLYVCI